MQGRGKKKWLVNKMGVWCLLVCGNTLDDGNVGKFYVLQVFFKCFISFILKMNKFWLGGWEWG